MRISIVALLLAVTSCSAKQDSPARRVVEIVGTDYAFQAPGVLPAGRTIFQFVNRGKVRHKLNVFMLKRGTTLQQYLDRRKQKKPGSRSTSSRAESTRSRAFSATAQMHGLT